MTTPVKRQRRKALTDAGRALLNQQRQKLNREQAALGERLVEEARQAQVQQEYVALRYKPEFNAISRGILRRVAGVLASEGVTPAIEVSQGEFSAWTDFDSIHVSYPGLDNDVRLTAATLRGMLYHEGGHIRWTTPFVDTLDLARQALGDAAWTAIIEANSNLHGRKFHHAWNALEDQRMETAVVSDSPRKASYFTPVIIQHMASNPIEAAANYPLLIWRRYLPRHIRAAARKAFIAFHDAQGVLSGTDLARSFEQVVTDYVTADNAADMLNAILLMEQLLQLHNTAFDLDDSGHSGLDARPHRSRKGNKSEVKPIPISPDMLDDDAQDGEDGEGQPVQVPQPNDSDVKGEEGEGKAAEKGKVRKDIVATQPIASEEASNEANETAATGEGEGEGDDESDDDSAGSGEGAHGDEDFQKMLDDAKAEAEAIRDSDRALDGDEDAFRSAIDNATSMLPVYVGGVSANNELTGKAEAMSQQIEDAFMEATMDRMPGWVQQQRRGILDVNRWKMRQPGNIEVFRQFTEDEAPGYNLAVSILLDYSGSMRSEMDKLATAAYAAKLACQRLGIPCTVTLWDTNAATLWDGNEQAAGLPIIRDAGGTNPNVALADLDNQSFDKDQHLVMVMTDGMWDGEWQKKTIQSYKRPGRRFLGFGYGVSEGALNKLGFNDAVQIKDLMMIPRMLERILPEMA